MNPQRIILKLLIALTRLAMEHDKGYMSRKTWTALSDAIREGEDFLEVR